LAHAASAYRSLTDLRGAVFAFSDPQSNTGYRHIADLLQRMNTSPERFFARTLFTYSHDHTVEAVRDGMVDGGVVDSLVWKGMVEDHPEITQAVAVIDRSPPFPINPVVVSPEAPAEFTEKLTRMLMAMSQEASGRAVLANLGAEGFVAPDETAYDAIVESWRRLGALSATSGTGMPP
jgi:phosphonate transport system substrate-binding protein